MQSDRDAVLADLRTAAARKWQGNQAAQQAGLFARAAAEIERLRTVLDRINDACSAMLHCPCCGETTNCLDDCTFAVDCPADAEHMQYLRDAIRDDGA